MKSQSKEAMSLKAKINNYAKSHDMPSQVVLQNLMFERFLERLSISEYKEKFVIKGGILVSSMVGLENRSTMDLDATLKNMPLSKKEVLDAVREIGGINLSDDVTFENFTLEPIRKDDFYGGFRIKLNAKFFTIVTPLSIDVSTGDAVTPNPVEYEYSCIFESEKSIKILAYNIETILAEKFETILSRGIINTRSRDFYDVYILTKTQNFNQEIFLQALKATCEHRGTQNILLNVDERLKEISDSTELMSLWKKYRNRFSYAKDVDYQTVMQHLKDLYIG